jgi:hypothetical protein
MVWQNVAKKALFVVLITNYQMKERINTRNSRSAPSTQGSIENSFHTIRAMRLLVNMALTLNCSPCLHPHNCGSHDRCRCPSEIHRLRDISLPSSTPKVAATTEQQEQHDDDNDKRCSIHGHFLPFRTFLT